MDPVTISALIGAVGSVFGGAFADVPSYAATGAVTFGSFKSDERTSTLSTGELLAAVAIIAVIGVVIVKKMKK